MCRTTADKYPPTEASKREAYGLVHNEKDSLLRRDRFYTSIIDADTLRAGRSYDQMPDLAIICILSYDPFGTGNFYYEARTRLEDKLEDHVDPAVIRERLVKRF